jgi:hypothetical protein
MTWAVRESFVFAGQSLREDHVCFVSGDVDYVDHDILRYCGRTGDMSSARKVAMPSKSRWRPVKAS